MYIKRKYNLTFLLIYDIIYVENRNGVKFIESLLIESTL